MRAHRTRARPAAMAVVVTMAVGAVVGVGAAAAPAQAAPPASPAPAPADEVGGGPTLAFGPCRDETLVAAGAECATLAVPLDHRDPGGPTIDIAVSRIAARGPAPRRGVLAVNPGGPGSPGLAYPVHLRRALGAVADGYDLVGFDPRFAGESSPITCGPTRFSDTLGAAGRDRAGFRASAARAEDFARRCRDRAAHALPHAGTADIARDLDLIRAALGERRLSYYGVSWGAELGAVYSQLFPGRVDRMVLDSSSEGTSRGRLLEQGPAAEAALDDWAGWAAAHHARYGLGDTGPAVRRTVERLVVDVGRRPATVTGAAGTHRIDDATLPLLVQRWLNHEDDDPSLAEAVRVLVDLAAGRPASPTEEMVEHLALFDAHDPALDNGLAAAWANLCDGGSWPSDPRAYWQQVRRSRRTQPVFGPLAANVRPCAFWPAAAREAPVPIGNAVPMLMVQAEGDNAAPAAGARRLHERLRGSRLVTADVRAHGVYGRRAEGRPPVPCVDRAVEGYLAGGPLPGDGTCPGPEAGASAGRVGATGRAP